MTNVSRAQDQKHISGAALPRPSQNKNNDDQWNYKFSFTKSINSQLTIECEQSDQIWIGWSHYGTRSTAAAASPKSDFAIPSSSKNTQLFNLLVLYLLMNFICPKINKNKYFLRFLVQFDEKKILKLFSKFLPKIKSQRERLLD
jgi:hypothetical protein